MKTKGIGVITKVRAATGTIEGAEGDVWVRLGSHEVLASTGDFSAHVVGDLDDPKESLNGFLLIGNTVEIVYDSEGWKVTKLIER